MALFITTALLLPEFAIAVPACPEPLLFTQPNGVGIQVTLCGDEFLNWTEDTNGNLIVFDEALKGYCYAEWTDDGPVTTGELVGGIILFGGHSRRVKAENIPKAVLEAAEQLREEFMADSGEQPTPPVNTLSVSAPVVNSVVNLRRKLLIIHVRWGDEKNIQPKPLTGQQIYDRVFNPNTSSVNKYYKELFGVQEDIIIPAEVTNPLDNCQGIIQVTLSGAHTNPAGNTSVQTNLLRQAVTAAAPSINFSLYDTNKDRILQTSELSIGVIVHGYETAVTGTSQSPSFWGMAVTTSFGQFNNVSVRNAFGTGAYHGTSDDRALTIGVICHELGHSAYAFDDVYDYGEQAGDGKSFGISYWSLMGSGNWGYINGGRVGSYPVYADAYNMAVHNIVTPGIISESIEGIRLDSHLDIYKITNFVKTNQYFLLQQRKYGSVDNYDRGGFIRSSNTGGLLIYHIDEAVNISRINDKNTHYRAGIEEAHGGTQHLQQTSGVSVTMGSGDLWGVSKFEFSASSDPSSGLYSAFTNNSVPPTQTQLSGVKVSNITWNRTSGFTTLNVVHDVKVSGAVKSYNPNNETTIRLMQGNAEKYRTVIGATSGSGQVEQTFAFSSVTPGTYSLIVTKSCHTNYTVQTITVGSGDVDLTMESRPGVRLMNLRCGDINGDGVINDKDLTMLWMLSNYNMGKVAATNPQCDLNGDGLINDLDLTILWGASNYNSGAISIP